MSFVFTAYHVSLYSAAMQPFEAIFDEVTSTSRRQGARVFSYELSNNTFYNVSGIARLAGSFTYVALCLIFLVVYINLRTTKSSSNDGESNGSRDDIDYYDYYYYNGGLIFQGAGSEVTKR